MDWEPTDKEAFNKQMLDNPRFEKAYELLCKNYSTTKIAEHLNVLPRTVRRWFKKASLPPRRYQPDREADRKAAEAVRRRALEGDGDEEAALEDITKEAVREIRRQASEIEDENIAALAESQTTAADKYQHYIASQAIKLLRDSIKNLKGPRTVRELSELDQLIRRSLGLNAKGGGSGKMTIDISILNNSTADKGRGATKVLQRDVVEAEVVPDPPEEKK